MKLFFFKRKSLLPWVVFFCVLSLSGLYLSMFLHLGWVPDDEGLLCQQAVRYLQGELPHRDFHETYTGGLTILSAWAFKIGGINALSPRYLLFGFSLLTLAFVFGIMRRGNTLGVASLLVLITLTWAYPNAYSGLPSWYVIGFWCVGVYCFERHRSAMEKGDQGFGWLLAAGVSAGLTVLMKISGIFFLGEEGDVVN
jgi:dolichyl-phosphate-mannose--protein O-mannosyl transferase